MLFPYILYNSVLRVDEEEFGACQCFFPSSWEGLSLLLLEFDFPPFQLSAKFSLRK